MKIDTLITTLAILLSISGCTATMDVRRNVPDNQALDEAQTKDIQAIVGWINGQIEARNKAIKDGQSAQ